MGFFERRTFRAAKPKITSAVSKQDVLDGKTGLDKPCLVIDADPQPPISRKESLKHDRGELPDTNEYYAYYLRTGRDPRELYTEKSRSSRAALGRRATRNVIR